MKRNKVGFTSQCHPELDSGSRCLDNQCGEMPNQVWHDTSFGFTLIELLVVVLIIGVLAAIALPQYQKAIMKSRFSTLKPIAKAVKDAQEIYYMRNGQYATQAQLADLDVGVPANAGITISDTAKHDFVRATHTGLPHNSYVAYLDHSENFAGNIYCEACDADENATSLCVAEGGTDEIANGNCTLYLLSGNGTGSFSSVLTSTPCTPVGSYNSCDKYHFDNKELTVQFYEGANAYRVDLTDASTNEPLDGCMCSGLQGSCWCTSNGYSEELGSVCELYSNIDICQ